MHYSQRAKSQSIANLEINLHLENLSELVIKICKITTKTIPFNGQTDKGTLLKSQTLDFCLGFYNLKGQVSRIG